MGNPQSVWTMNFMHYEMFNCIQFLCKALSNGNWKKFPKIPNVFPELDLRKHLLHEEGKEKSVEMYGNCDTADSPSGFSNQLDLKQYNMLFVFQKQEQIHILALWLCAYTPLVINILTYTGGITKFSAKENFRKILKVSHLSLGFSLDENCNKISTSHRVLPEFTYSYRVSLVFP